MSSSLVWRRPDHRASATRTQEYEQDRQRDCVRGLDGSQPQGLHTDALTAAELFIASTVEAVHPDLPAAVLLRYLEGYRAHLAAVVAASRHAE